MGSVLIKATNETDERVWDRVLPLFEAINSEDEFLKRFSSVTRWEYIRSTSDFAKRISEGPEELRDEYYMTREEFASCYEGKKYCKLWAEMVFDALDTDESREISVCCVSHTHPTHVTRDTRQRDTRAVMNRWTCGLCTTAFANTAKKSNAWLACSWCSAQQTAC